MKNLIALLLLLIFTIACQNEKTAFVDNNKIVESFDALQERELFYKEAEDSLKVRIELMVAQSGYQDLVSKYQTQEATMSASEREELYNKIMQLQQSLGQQQQLASQQLQQRKGKERDSLVNIVKSFVIDFGKENGYTYIFGSNDAGNILYGSENKDITDQIIEELNTKYTVDASEVKESTTDTIVEQ